MKDDKNKQIIVRVTPELHRSIKLLSVETGRSINDYVVSYFEKLLKENGCKNDK